MAFFLKKKKEGENIQEIKNAVEGKKIPKKIEKEQVKKKPEDEIIQEIEEEMSAPKEEIPTEIEEEIPEEVEEKKEPLEEEIKTLTEEPITEPVAEITEIEKASFAPLFVKLDRYKSVLDTINELKSSIISIKSSLDVQKQIENLREENRQLLEGAISKVDEKILSLDSEFLRPKGFEEEMPQPEIKTEGLQGALTDLKKQIEGLKEELKTIS
jgi:hypothetical protein